MLVPKKILHCILNLYVLFPYNCLKNKVYSFFLPTPRSFQNQYDVFNFKKITQGVFMQTLQVLYTVVVQCTHC
jgi:hypothetical protein